ncbi:Clavaminate synthase-like protein [Suhomyces tanzawaensis NRRL Y-17324]|uniref:JmjC domain-containing histone demethylation protein 1 n=1 Tax=Suhomyces tanzawaensis NRRL Y-17324 TaxID=984487 RepID=A0A1E4SF77_9ASCO|nr:Clavaminate synthase-like protein [Suhomyces tanzawaensis NRRL Y-17324]ODV78174.1 Clavaminate synthase-like protein [Suhomyces tanzawaensis NRRL Y-17324]
MPSIDVCPVCVDRPLEQSHTVTSVAWIQCEACNQWYHSVCVQLGLLEMNNLHSYHCAKCTKTHGPSTFRRKSKRSKIQIDYVALNDGEVFAVDKLSHPHVTSLLEFATTGSDSEHIYIQNELTTKFALKTGLRKPILVPNATEENSGMKLPLDPKQITLDYITDKVGEDTSLEVMDVLSQQGVHPGWNMGQWRDYFNSDEHNRDRIRNVISLEISDVHPLGTQFRRPQMVRDLDLVDKVWDRHDEQPRSKVTKYCLMSVKGSFTDFHIDFGGTSVYYTVCTGSKTFLMFPSTSENLALYEAWCLEQNQNFMWFCDYSKNIKGKKVRPSQGFKVTLHEGDLFIIPSGWIHAVYTPEDSIVIGGNFLTLRDMATQLHISTIEKTTKVPSKFRFPMFNKVLWLASWYYYTHQDEFLRDREPALAVQPEHELLQGLIRHLTAHYELSKTNATAKRSVPTDVIGKDVLAYLSQLLAWASTFYP